MANTINNSHNNPWQILLITLIIILWQKLLTRDLRISHLWRSRVTSGHFHKQSLALFYLSNRRVFHVIICFQFFAIYFVFFFFRIAIAVSFAFRSITFNLCLSPKQLISQVNSDNKTIHIYRKKHLLVSYVKYTRYIQWSTFTRNNQLNMSVWKKIYWKMEHLTARNRDTQRHSNRQSQNLADSLL